MPLPYTAVSATESSKPVPSHLQTAAALHLTAIEFYTLAAARLGRIGFPGLRSRFAADADEERAHLTAVLDRLEFFWQAPDMTHQPATLPEKREDVELLLRSATGLEAMAAAAEREGIAAARAVHDEGTAVVFAGLLAGSEESLRRLEGDLAAIAAIGIDNWLANYAAG